MPDAIEIAIIGAGVVGLAIASELAEAGREVYVLEKNETFGQEQSSRSSEVVHSGVLTRKDTLRSALCLEGNRLLYEISKKYGLPCRRCGKLFIAARDAELDSLEMMYKGGIENDIELKMLSKRELRQVEPNLSAIAAFIAPSAGTADSYSIMRYYYGKARENNASFVFKSRVTGIEKAPGGYEVRVEDDSDDASFRTRIIINCAGLYSDRISELAGIDIDKAEYGIRWGKGEYYSIGGVKKGMLNTLIYPVPSGIGPGIHTCMNVEGRLRLGPMFYWVDEIDYKVDDSRRAIFEESSIMKALPFIKPSDLEPESAGIMVYSKEGIKRPPDFLIKDESEYGLPGFINLVGIGSPAFTASPAIARYVRRIVDEMD